MTNPPNEFQLTFESDQYGWARVVFFVVIGIGCASLAFLIPADSNSKVLGTLFFVALGILAIVTGFTSRALGGTVTIHDGWVRVYERARSGDTNLKFEAPYLQFREVLLEYIPANEGGGPLYSVFLVHNDAKPRRIALFNREGSETLDREDKETIEKICLEMGIPTRRG